MTAEDHRQCSEAKAEIMAVSAKQRAAAEKRRPSDAAQPNRTKSSKPSTSLSVGGTKGENLTTLKRITGEANKI